MPRFTRTSVRLAVPATLLVVGLSGCTGANVGGPAPTTLPGLPATTAATTTTTKAADVDYQRLLLTAADLSDADDTFSPRPDASQPTGVPGASAFFVNDEDTRAISDTVMVYPDAATATSTLRQTTAKLTDLVAGGTPAPAPVGTDGITISGTYPDSAKAVTLLYFTEGRALVRLEFQSATGDATTERFVNGVGKMQQVALRVGLDEPQ